MEFSEISGEESIKPYVVQWFLDFDIVILFVCISLRFQRYLFVNIPIECALVPIFIFGDN